ncbi:MAG TPA: glutamate-5-semialdehyde dehydrogenase [Gaiellales bacterium]|nr:glutamate-5-semialdehyde dehydrogenase [Gaiellales bacterium]
MRVVRSDISGAARAAGRRLATTPGGARDHALEMVARTVESQAQAIVAANQADLAAAPGLRPALVDRLTLTEDRVAGLAAGVRAVAALPDPLGTVIREFVRPDGLRVTRLRVPLGVVAIIYEARPNVTTDAAALALKSGNACILRGSRTATRTNRALVGLVRDAIAESGLAADAVQQLEAERDQLAAFVADPHAADVVIPRGGEELKAFLLEHSRVPVLAAAGGNNHVYVDLTADADMAEAIVINAKTQRPGVCNAAETLLVHRERGDLRERIAAALEAHGVELVEGEDAWETEFLDLRMAVRTVGSLDEALDHIAAYGTGHSEAIVTGDETAAERFLAEVDAAAVYVNASTRFTDGGEFGMGAEMGISTNRLHARGPVALEELTTSKYVARGTGQVRR